MTTGRGWRIEYLGLKSAFGWRADFGLGSSFRYVALNSQSIDADFGPAPILIALVDFSPQAVKVSSAWAGFYDYNTADQNALLGLLPGLKSVARARAQPWSIIPRAGA